MYKCICGNKFEEPEVVFGLGGDADEAWGVCPSCHGDDFQEVYTCSNCEKDYLLDDDNMVSTFLCKNCAEKLWTPENALKFIEHEDLEKDFFVDWLTKSRTVHASMELIDICHKNFDQMGEFGKSEIYSFCKYIWSEWAEWAEANLV